MRGRNGLGGGDPKMFVGLWLGASITGLAIALAFHSSGREMNMTSRLSFGTLLAITASRPGYIWLYLAIWSGTMSEHTRHSRPAARGVHGRIASANIATQGSPDPRRRDGEGPTQRASAIH